MKRRGNILKRYQNEIYIVLIILLSSMISFNLGRIFALKSSGQIPKIEEANISEILNQEVRKEEGKKEELKIDFRVVASKNGTRYHYLWCPGAKKIKVENLITFNSEEEAKSRGYTLAGNCRK